MKEPTPPPMKPEAIRLRDAAFSLKKAADALDQGNIGNAGSHLYSVHRTVLDIMLDVQKALGVHAERFERYVDTVDATRKG